MIASIPTGIAVTGVTGFIGRHLVSRFRDSGKVVLSLQRNPDNAMTVDGVELRNWSLQSPELDTYSGSEHFAESTLIHLAALAHRRGRGYSAEHEFESLNTAATLRLAESAARCGIRHFIFMSSIGVLGGDSGDGIFDENSQPAPSSPYARSKWLAEQGLAELAMRTGLHVTVLRPPVVYGPNAPGNFGSLARAVRSGMPLPFGSIDNARQMLAMDNLLDAIVAVVADGGAAYRAFNLADRESISTPGLCRRMADILQVRDRTFRFPPGALRALLRGLGRDSLAQGLLGNLRISTAAIEAAINWRPRVTLQQGLEKALANDDDH